MPPLGGWLKVGAGLLKGLSPCSHTASMQVKGPYPSPTEANRTTAKPQA